jgi:hypothetical protein
MRYGNIMRASVNIATTHKLTRCSLRLFGVAQTVVPIKKFVFLSFHTLTDI